MENEMVDANAERDKRFPRKELVELSECAVLYTLPIELPITDDDFDPPDMRLLQYQAVIADLAIFGNQPDAYWREVPDWLKSALTNGETSYRKLSEEYLGSCAKQRTEIMSNLHAHFGIPESDLLFPHINRVPLLPREKWPNQKRYWAKRWLNNALDMLHFALTDREPTITELTDALKGLRKGVHLAQIRLGIKASQERNIRIPKPMAARNDQ
jgi:hypothetical protein